MSTRFWNNCGRFGFSRTSTTSSCSSLRRYRASVEFPANKVLYREGQPLTNIYLILSGSVSIEICAAGIGCRRIMTVTAGDMLGITPAVGQSLSTGTTRTLAPTKAIELNASQVLTLCEHNSRFGYEFMRQVALAISQRLNATRLQLLDVFGARKEANPRTKTSREGKHEIQQTAGGLLRPHRQAAVAGGLDQLRNGVIARSARGSPRPPSCTTTAIRSQQLPIGYLDEQDGGKYRLQPAAEAGYFDYVVGPHSLKSYLFPPRETLLRCSVVQGQWQLETPVPAAQPLAVIGIRSCDLHALEVLDRVFLSEPYVDVNYEARRNALFVVAVNCRRAAATCFCHSMKTGPAVRAGYDLALTELEERFVVEVGSDLGGQVVTNCDWGPCTMEEINQSREQPEKLRKAMQARQAAPPAAADAAIAGRGAATWTRKTFATS